MKGAPTHSVIFSNERRSNPGGSETPVNRPGHFAQPPRVCSRRRALRLLAAGSCALWSSSGCFFAGAAYAGKVDKIWGGRGNRPGRLQRPRAIAIDQQDRLYLADMTDRIQVFDTDGEFLHYWRLPDFDKDGSTGLSIAPDGNLWVADTHFYRILKYTPQGRLMDRFDGSPGAAPGQFGYIRDVVEDAQGNRYTCEYSDLAERVQVFSPTHQCLYEWGTPGAAPGQFARPEGLALDSHGRLFVADSCNHRIQVFDKQSGKLLDYWGQKGHDPGELFYPMDISFGHDGNLYVCENGNHRLQKFTPEGSPLGTWGVPGRKPGQLNGPWGVAVDRQGRIHVADSENHRVQRLIF